MGLPGWVVGSSVEEGVGKQEREEDHAEVEGEKDEEAAPESPRCQRQGRQTHGDRERGSEKNSLGVTGNHRKIARNTQSQKEVETDSGR